MLQNSTLLFSFLLAWSISTTAAQNPHKNTNKHTISGYVIDALTGERLIGAQVIEARSQTSATSNNYGFYSLTIPADTVLLVGTDIGLSASYHKFVLTRDTTLDIRLGEEQGPTIEVVAEDLVQRIEDRNQMSQINIPIEQIRAMPAFLGEIDILKVIQLLPGVQSTEGSSGLYIRGGSPDQTLILLDGVPVYNAYHLFGFFSVFNSEAVQTVQLTKGGYPARYGGRLAAVLEINTREGNMKRWEGAGSIGLLSSHFMLSGPIVKDKSAFVLALRRTYIDLLALPLVALSQRGQSGKLSPQYYFYDINAKANYVLNPKNRLLLSFYAGNDRFGIKYTESLQNPNNSANESFTLKSGVHWGNITAALRWNHKFNGKLFSNSTLTYSRYNFGLGSEITYAYDSADSSQTSAFSALYSSGISDLGAKIDLDYAANSEHLLRFGGGLVYHVFRPGATQLATQLDSASASTTYGSPSTQAIEYQAYIEDDINLGERLGFNVGVHASAFGVEGKMYYSAQPRISARVKLPYHTALKASFATMTQYIHLLSNEGIGLPTDLWVPTTARVAPQQAWQAALGFATTLKGDYEISLEGYYRGMSNLISYLPGASFLATNQNSNWEDKIATGGTGKSYGAELFVQKPKGRLTGWVSYTLAWSWRQFAGTDINWGRPYPFKYDRRHNLAIAAVWQINQKVSFSAAWVFATGNAVTLPTTRYLAPDGYSGGLTEVQAAGDKNAFRMPNYHRLDCSIDIKKTLRKWSHTWSFGVYNLYNRQNAFFIMASRDLSTGAQQFQQISLFPMVPSIRWSFKF